MGYLKNQFTTLSARDILKGVRNPHKALKKVRDVRASIRKDLMDYDEERADRPRRLANLLNLDLADVKRYQREIESESEFNSRYEERRQTVRDTVGVTGTSSRTDCQTMYVLTRALKPETVVVTGVLYGAFDAHITAALEKNGNGELYSIDLPDPPEKLEYGYLIPPDQRGRWNLNLGESSDILDDLLTDLGGVDMFVHDSLHTESHMTFEYETAYPHISNGGVLASHDILMTSAFQDFVEKKQMEWTTVANVGVGIV